MSTRIARWSVAAGAAVALALVAGAARAQQIDTNPPLPNVLILLDNSGSMERMIDGSLPESNPLSACNCDPSTGICNFTTQPLPGRFANVQEAFTGTFANGYNCAAMPRSTGGVFTTEYQIAGVQPYDTNYYLPYHRPIAEDTTQNPPVPCVFAPSALPGANTPNGVGPLGTGAGGNATDFPANAIVNRTYGAVPTLWKTCQFQQFPNGAIDSARDLMRFGLMTFDQDPSGATGVTSGATPQVLNPAFAGMWSYYPGWNTGAACTYFGLPAGCTSQATTMAVGARNYAAPPWEGRMMPFPKTYDLTAQETNNDQIQEVIMATRPYGATPLAGMFAGAQYYFWNDPIGPQQTDAYVQGGCRHEYIILLTDGAPNEDMRSEPGPPPTAGCDSAGSPSGICPFPLPETTALTLSMGSGGMQKVTTYVIGFAVSSFQDQGQTVYCSSLVQNGSLSGVCLQNPVPSQYAPCCELQKIAVAGGSGQAYFADTPGDLQNAIGAILADIAKNTTTRTTPAYAPVATNVLADPNNPQTNASVYLASFDPSPGRPWSGDIQREREVCTYSGSGFTVPPPTIQTTAGDDFAANLNSGTGPVRRFIALQPDPITSLPPVNGVPAVDATATIRPYVSATARDGMGRYSATTYTGLAPSVMASITPSALNIYYNNCYQYYSINGGLPGYLNSTQCRDLALSFVFGQQSDPSAPAGFQFTSRYGNAFGDVYHAMPAIVSPPSSLLQDAAYVGFRNQWQLCNGTLSPPNCRKNVVYVATNDGLLHAFWGDETKLENNEMWALVPPAVMPNLLSTYPSSHEFLLDGSPIVKDVVWDRSIANSSDPTTFHTMLVAGYGPYQRGYYAVDVTNPDPTSLPNGTVPNEPPVPGPVFRWQLTKSPAGNMPLFGQHSATPAITTLYMDPGDGLGAREIGVAILPGGEETGPTTTAPSGPSCTRWPKSSDSAPIGSYPARAAVRCWGTNHQSADFVTGRSVSIVRLDTGEVLRVFARKNDFVQYYPSDTIYAHGRVTNTSLDSPMTGTPMIYPGDVGADTTKFFMGDADGTIWRFDVSSSDPSQWFGELYLDLYNSTVDTSTTSWSDGQPFEVTPVLSLDSSGEVVLDAASGSTETFDTTGVDYVYSITEKVQGSPPKLRANVNWWLGPPTFQAGERVSGPMTVFNSTLYFSTYAAAQTGQAVCTGGLARLWGRDFVKPDDPNDLSKGGLRELQPPPPNPPQSPAPVFIQPSDYDSSLLGEVIPGVSIMATPACASLGTPGSDSYVYGGSHSAMQNFTAGSYSLFATVGGKSPTGMTNTFSESVTPPVAPTMIDSWAEVLE